MIEPNIKAISLIMWAGNPSEEISLTNYHLNTTGHIDLLIHLHKLGAHVHRCTGYGVSIIIPVGRTVYR